MCIDCFLFEIDEFKSEKEFQDFDLDLLKKVHNTKTIKRIKNPSILDFQKINQFKRRFDNTIIVEVYKCNTCNDTWYLSAPNFPWTGFLKKE